MSSLPELGSEIAGCRLERIVARGGMGIVYEATHLRLNRKRAIKLLQPEYALDQDFRARFLKEAELASELEHPNAVSVYDAGDVAGHLISWSSSQVL